MERVCRVTTVGGRLRAVDAFGDEALDVAGLPGEGSWVAVREDGTYWTLARAGTRLAELVALVSRAGIRAVQGSEAEAEARAVGEDLALDTLADFRHLPLVPIDEVTSRDLDQAVAVERRGEGWVVWYALADAAWFVRPGSMLYEESIARGSTYYLPGLVVPMLPRVLSEGRISLNAGEDRRAMLFELTLDATGRCVDRAIHRARIHCRHKLDFRSVQAFLEGAEVTWDDDVQASLRLLPEVGRRRMELAEERGVVRYRRTEVDVHLEGLRFVALDGPRNDVERYNEQISLLTNVQGALFLLEDADRHPDVEPIYRVHEAPSASRMEELRDLTVAVARDRGLDPSIWVWDPASRPLAAYLEQLPQGPVAQAVHRQAMIVNRPSHFAAVPGLHFGVGADVYGRFTAPMREVVGVYLHHEVWEKLGVVGPLQNHGPEVRDRVVESSNAARELQRKLNRDVNRLVLDDLFASDLAAGRDAREGVVLGLTPSRVHVQLVEPRIDVKVYTAHIERDLGTSLELVDGVVLRGPDGAAVWRLGDRVRVVVVERDDRRDRWNLALRSV
ncbi:MAG: RNB domain-containing ribonuclease [Alphaproteobacteria bacterium]|nr:RNB domain-containing ribonuclease [Alphaproteobacteria bacterium]